MVYFSTQSESVPELLQCKHCLATMLSGNLGVTCGGTCDEVSSTELALDIGPHLAIIIVAFL